MDWASWVKPPDSYDSVALYVVAAVVAVSLVAISKGGFGGGVGMLAVPLMMQVAGARDVLAMWLPMLLVCDFFTLRQYPGQWNPRAMWLIVPGALAGIVAGWFILEHTREHDYILKTIIGAVCLFFVALWLVKRRLEAAAADKPPWVPSWSSSSPIGVACGITTVIAHAAGSVMTMYLLPQKLDQRVYVGTAARFYLMLNLIKAPLFVLGGIITWPALRASFWMWLLVPPGVLLGSWLNRKISPGRFVVLIHVFLAISGIKLILDGTVLAG